MKFCNYLIEFLALTLVGLLGTATTVGANTNDEVIVNGELGLEQALEMAHIFSADLHAARIHVQAAQKDREASGVWKSPELKFEGEGIGGDNDGFSEGEYTVGLKQEVPFGGRQEKQKEVALQSIEIATQESLEKMRELDYMVRKVFLEIVYIQETGKIQAEQEELGRAFVEVAKRRHKAGGSSELEVVQSELELERILFAQTCCLGELQAAQSNMASLIGISVEIFPTLVAPYYELPPLDDLTLDESHPTLLRLTAQSEKAEAEARLAKAQDVSTISLGAGYVYEVADDVDSFVVSASIPLGFNKRGRTRQAAELLRAEALLTERDAAYRDLQAELAEAKALYSGAKAQAEMGRDKLIPIANKAYELTQAGYESGRFSWLELIASQQRLADIRINYIDALKDAHLAQITILKSN